MLKKREKNDTSLKKMRLDKWLWAARFFKTRMLAKRAIEKGRVLCGGSRVKASKIIETGAIVQIKIGQIEKIVDVIRLCEKRGPYQFALTLYKETQESINKRTARQEEMRMAKASMGTARKRKPNKKERRQIIKFKDGV